MTRTGEDLGKPLLIEVLEEQRRAIGTSLVVQARLRLTNQTGSPIRVESFALRAGTPPAEVDEEAVRREVARTRSGLDTPLTSSVLEPEEAVVGWVVHGLGRPNYGDPSWSFEVVDAEGVTHLREVPAR